MKHAGSATSVREIKAFGPFEFDVVAKRLARGGVEVALQPQPAQVLAALLQNAGSLVARDDLRHAVWDEGVFVDFDRNLNYCVNQIRRALGDRSGSPKYIATARGKGYAFIAPCRSIEAEPALPHRSRLVARSLRTAIAVLSVLLVFTAKGHGPARSDSAARSPGYAAYLKGLHYFRIESDRQELDGRGSLPLLKKATELDPLLAPAQVALSRAYVRRAIGDSGHDADFDAAEQAARTALRLEPSAAPAELTLGLVRMFRDWDPAAATPHMERAVALDPGDFNTAFWYAGHLITIGHFDPAYRYMQQFEQESPLSPMFWHTSYLYYYARAYDEALARARLIADMKPDDWMARRAELLALNALQRWPEAQQAASSYLASFAGGADNAEAVQASSDPREAVDLAWDLLSRRYLEDRVDSIEATLETLLWNAVRGRKRATLDDLEELAERRWPMLIYLLAAEPALGVVHDEPRFAQLVAKVRRPPHARPVMPLLPTRSPRSESDESLVSARTDDAQASDIAEMSDTTPS